MPTDIPVFTDGPDADGHSGSLFDDVSTHGDGRRTGADRLVQGSYEPALALAEEAVHQAARRFAALGRAVRPDEIEMEFGVSVNCEGHIGIAKAGAAAQFRFTFRWNTAQPQQRPLPGPEHAGDAEEAGEGP